MAELRTEALLRREATPSYAFAFPNVAPCKRSQGVDKDRARLGVCGWCSAKRLRDGKRLDHPTATPSQLAPPAPPTFPAHAPEVAPLLLPRPILCPASLSLPYSRGDFALCSLRTLAVRIPPVGKQASHTSPMSSISTGAGTCAWFIKPATGGGDLPGKRPIGFGQDCQRRFASGREHYGPVNPSQQAGQHPCQAGRPRTSRRSEEPVQQTSRGGARGFVWHGSRAGGRAVRRLLGCCQDLAERGQ